MQGDSKVINYDNTVQLRAEKQECTENLESTNMYTNPAWWGVGHRSLPQRGDHFADS